MPKAQRPLQATIARIGSTLGQLYYYSDFIRSAFYVVMAHHAAERLGPSGELAMAHALQGYFYAMIGDRRLSMHYHRLSLEAGFTENLVRRQGTTDFGVFLGLARDF